LMQSGVNEFLALYITDPTLTSAFTGQLLRINTRVYHN